MNANRRRQQKQPSRRRFGNPHLAGLSDDELLDLRFCDLDLKIEGTPLEDRINQLFNELAAKNLRFRPHFWLSDEWFTPDGVPGIAIPFYLADSRLMRLERQMMLEVEGGTPEWCMRILRHEAGHALDNAYRLRRRRTYREMFGLVSAPYPETYSPKPYSRSYVINIDMWYAQSHPVEDFAETFAVWLKPRSRWRQMYKGWPAIKKLEYVDRLMQEIADAPMLVWTRQHCDSLKTLKTTLREHYDKKRAQYSQEARHTYDHELRRLFSTRPDDADKPSAAVFLNRIRHRLRRDVSEWTGQFQFAIDMVLREMIQRCRELKLRVDRPEDEVERDLLIVITMHTMHAIRDGKLQIAL